MIRKIFGVLLLAATAFAFGACDKENNEKPTPQPAPKVHSGEEAEPVRAELILAGGHFHGVAFHQDADAKGITYKKAVQHLTFVRKGDAWELEKGSAEAFRVLSSTQYLYPYGLWIKYYDAKGQDITATIAANGESRTHQHFFVPADVKPTFDGKAEKDDQIADSLLNYVYMEWCSACRLWSMPRAKKRAIGKPSTLCPTRNSDRPNSAWCFPPLAPTASPKNWPRPTGSPTFSAKWTRRAARSGSDFLLDCATACFALPLLPR